MKILGHRGAVHATAPENTLASVERALRQGADGVEVDVRVTADGVPVCHHDPCLERTTGDPREVEQTDYADLPWIGSHPIPRLSEVLDLVCGQGQVVVELKNGSSPLAVAAAAVAVLRRHPLDAVTVSSFDRHQLEAVRDSGIPVTTALLGKPARPFSALVRRALQDGHAEVHPHVSSVLVRPEVVERVRGLGLAITPWTVDRPADLQVLLQAGVDAVICDDPGQARGALPGQGYAATA